MISSSESSAVALGPSDRIERGNPWSSVPSNGRIRVGIVSPCCYLGGAERWISDLLDFCDTEKIHWVGVAIQSSPTVPEILTVRADWEEHCPVLSGEDSIRSLARHVDVLVTWGLHSSHLARLIPTDLPVIEVSHCAFETASAQDQCAMPRSKVVAVAPASLRGVPPRRRDSAKIILNAISAERVEPKKSRSEMRAEWGVPDNSRVVLWLSRIAREKDPFLFIDGISRLPGAFKGVMIGAGLYTAEAKAYAAKVAPHQIVFPGPTYEIGSALAAADVMVMTSPSEGCCYAVMEAWKAGLPLISKKVGLLELEKVPELARLLPSDATGQDVALEILRDWKDTEGTASRVKLAKKFADDELSPEAFGTAWTDEILSMVKGPSLWSMAGNFARSMVDHAAGGFRSTSLEVQAERKRICEACPRYDLPAGRCMKCGCFGMDLKRSMASSVCPEDPPRWQSV